MTGCEHALLYLMNFCAIIVSWAEPPLNKKYSCTLFVQGTLLPNNGVLLPTGDFCFYVVGVVE